MPRFSIFRLLGLIAATLLLSTFRLSHQLRHCVETMSFSGDGSRLLVTRMNVDESQILWGFVAEATRTISILDATDGATNEVVLDDSKLGAIGPALLLTYGKRPAAFDPKSNRVLVLGSASDLPRNDTDDPDIQARIVPATPKEATDLAVASVEGYVASADEQTLTVTDVDRHTTLMKVEELQSPFNGMTFSKDGNLLATNSCNGLRVWTVKTGTVRPAMTEHTRMDELRFCFFPDNSLLVGRRGLRRYDTSGKLISALSETMRIEAVDVSRDGRLVAAAIYHLPHVLIFNAETNQPRPIDGPASATSVCFSPDASRLAIGDYEGNVSLVDVATGKRVWTATAPDASPIPWKLILLPILGTGVTVWWWFGRSVPASPPDWT